MNTIRGNEKNEHQKQGISADLPDNERDLERLKGDNAVFDLPEVKDIPGQEKIRAMPPGEMADTTISSDDEEGAGILDDESFDDERPVVIKKADEENSVIIDTAPAPDEDDDDYIFDDEDGDEGNDAGADQDTKVSETDIDMLDQDGPREADSDSDNLRRAKLDHTDWDGTPLNERSSARNIAGSDLDVPGAELDDENEEIGEEDEENNLYSEADTD